MYLFTNSEQRWVQGAVILAFVHVLSPELQEHEP